MDQQQQEAFRMDMVPVKIDWHLFIHKVSPPQIENTLGKFIFSKQVMYRPSRVTYSTRGTNALEEIEIDCE
jgi:hypothetical protein